MLPMRATWVVILFAASSVASALPSERLEPGVVVEKVTKDLACDRAGMREGDVILTWSGPDGSVHQIESPFDLFATEVEQAPRGAISLQGRRGAERHVWMLGRDAWGVVARPNLPPSLQSLYNNSQELAKAGKATEAFARLSEAKREIQAFESPWLGSWLRAQIARNLVEAHLWKEADDAYEEAIREAAQTGLSQVVVQLLWNRAGALAEHNDWSGAEKRFQQSVTESKKLGSNSVTAGQSLNFTGGAALQQGNLVKAEECFREAVAIWQNATPDSLALAAGLQNLGLVAWSRGDLVQAQEQYQRALAVTERVLPNSREVATNLVSLGVVAWRRGDLKRAEEYYHQALAIYEKLDPGSLSVATAVNNLGLVALDRGDLVKAEEYYRRALAIQNKLNPETLNVATMLLNLGDVAWRRGDLARAEDYYHQALTLREKLAPGSLAVAECLTNLGNVSGERGDLAKAEEYNTLALAIKTKVAPGSLDVAENLVNLGEVATRRGDLVAAERYHQQALGIAQQLAPMSLITAGILNNLGDVARNRGDLLGAEQHYRAALAIRQKLAPGSMGHAESLAALGVIMRKQHQVDAALQFFEQALNAIENQAANLGGAEEIRSGFRAKHAEYYRQYWELLLDLGRPDLAFQVLERSRSRTLLEVLAEARLDIHQGVAAELLEQESSVRRLLTAKSNSLVQTSNDNRTREQAAATSSGIERLLAEYQQIEGQIRTSSPKYAALARPQPLDAMQVQQQLLDPNTLLLEYALGEDHSHLWVLTQESLTIYELPKRAEIEAAARRLYVLLTDRNRKVPEETDSQRRARRAKAEAEYPQAAAVLSRMVLLPAAAKLKGKRLLIVSDGALQYIPLAALPAPSEQDRSAAPSVSSAPPLILEHEIVNLPSASTLAVLRRQLAPRPPGQKAVAIFADPVFDGNDDRTQRSLHSESSSQAAYDHTISSQAGQEHLKRSDHAELLSPPWEFSRLPFTRREAETIYSVARRGEATKRLDFEASKDAVLHQPLKNYRILHFATHGLINTERPELSALVFSLVDRRGRPQDGFLRLFDIYNLDLSADLVVLSACQTALGKEIQQEGLVGLTRGFMYAGATRVVASLWNVDDEATSELMKKFYEGMLKNGQTPAQALRAAQVWMYSQKNWRFPYYWAGFALQGEWK